MTDVSKVIDALETEKSLLIGGQWRAGGAGTFDVEDPATLERLAKVSDGNPDDATAAVDAAAKALDGWWALAPRDRSEILRRTWEFMIRDKSTLAALISAENGKSKSDSEAEVVYGAEFFRWFAEEAVRSSGRYAEAPAGGVRNFVTHRPIGVAALVTPWNFPAAMATRKLAPALAAGCTVVLKPASQTPLTAFAVARLMAEAGLPDGVVNIVPTSTSGDVVGAWLDDDRVKLISFTGSTGVGRELMKHAADRIVVSAMELGGNAPFVVAADADIDAAVDGAMIAKLRGGGQACTAANRFYVHADVVEEFVDKLGARIEKLTVGAAVDGADIGPMITGKALEEISAKVDEAVEAGAKVAARAALPEDAKGHFLAPVLLVDVPSDARLVTEEIFGPVAPVVTWDDEADMLRQVNASEFGLAAYVYSTDLQYAIDLSEAIESGMVGINRGLVSDPAAPFGGMKQSGIGREGAREGLEEFTETQYLSVNWPAR